MYYVIKLCCVSIDDVKQEYYMGKRFWVVPDIENAEKINSEIYNIQDCKKYIETYREETINTLDKMGFRIKKIIIYKIGVIKKIVMK